MPFFLLYPGVIHSIQYVSIVSLFQTSLRKNSGLQIPVRKCSENLKISMQLGVSCEGEKVPHADDTKSFENNFYVSSGCICG